MVTSGATKVRPAACSDSRITNSVPPWSSISSTSTSLTSASGGASARTRAVNASAPPGAPSISTTTPSPVFQTAPDRCSDRASA